MSCNLRFAVVFVCDNPILGILQAISDVLCNTFQHSLELHIRMNAKEQHKNFYADTSTSNLFAL